MNFNYKSLLFILLFSSSYIQAKDENETISIEEAWDQGFIIEVDEYKNKCTEISIIVPNTDPTNPRLNKPIVGLYYEVNDEQVQAIRVHVESSIKNDQIEKSSLICIPNNTNYKIFLVFSYTFEENLEEQLICMKEKNNEMECTLPHSCSNRWTVRNIESILKK